MSNQYTIEHDRIRLLEDTDGDGRADKSTVFADGFNAIEDGTGAGVLAIDGKVFYTCIPKLWLLTDDDGDGRADKRVPLYDGFGVRVAFRGHDMHGLIVGPDGRLYFSIGDRGYNVQTPNGRLAKPDQGAVFRCNLDGSDLEVFATGLRNPQELAFDDFGNLFTGDNHSDGGDRARWTYIVEGSDSGWRMYHQYPSDRGPWNREKLWHPAHAGQAAYIVPPIINIADGPSGLAYYPGTGLDDKYKGHFFLADFRGSAANSGIRSFAMIPKGASFELVDSQEFIWSILATDVDFGFDGGLYVADWVEGWDGPGKGRLYRFRDDVPIPSVMPALVKLISQPALVDPLLRRVLNANFRAGTAENAQGVAAVAANPKVDEAIRLEAIVELLDWNSPGKLDRVINDYRPIEPRTTDIAAVRPVLGPLFGGPRKVRELAAKLAGQYGIRDVEPFLLKIIGDAANAGSERVAALNALETLKSPHLRSVVDASLTDSDSAVDLTPDFVNPLRKRLVFTSSLDRMTENLRDGTLANTAQPRQGVRSFKVQFSPATDLTTRSVCTATIEL